MKKLIALLLTLLMLAALVGCSAKSMDAANSIATEAPKENGSFGVTADDIYDYVSEDLKENSSDSITAPAVTDRKLIRKIYMNTETEDMDTLLLIIDSKVAALGGYIESRDVYTGSRYATYSSRRATLTIRVPKDKLDDFVTHVGNESNVTSSNETTEDVTLTYVATQSRMIALQKEEARLLELIDKAANLTELLELEKRLTEIRTELEQVTSQLLLYDNLVEYGTITISIQEVKELTPVEEPGFWSRMGNGFADSLGNLWSFLKELSIFLVAALPYLVPLGVIALVIFLSIRRSVRKRRKARAIKKALADETE